MKDKQLSEDQREKFLMLGDNLYTDIELGIRANIATCLVETGKHKREDIKDPEKNIHMSEPTYVIGKFGIN